jgi:hypothetical protein
MEIVSPVRLGVGIALLVVALVLVPRALKERGFGKMRQGAAICLIGGALFIAAGFGYSLWGGR